MHGNRHGAQRRSGQHHHRVLGGDADTLAGSRLLEARGILAVAIRPPTVPPGTGRLRLALSAAHSDADLDQLVHAFQALGRAGA